MKKTKPLLTRLLLALVNENARYDTILKVIESQVRDAEEKGQFYLKTSDLRELLNCSSYPDEGPVQIPSYEDFIREYANDEDET